MGSKKLKAISVTGTGRVSLAHPERITQIARALAKEGKPGPLFFGSDMNVLNRQLAAEGDGSVCFQACTEGCVTPCQTRFQGVPGVAHNRRWSGAWFCVAGFFRGTSEDAPDSRKVIYDWQLERRAAFEMNVLSNRYGLNEFDLLVGMVPWLIACQREGLISELNEQTMNWRSPQFWAEFLRTIAYREGLGDTLAEGGWAASQALHLGEDLARSRYAGWGHAAHWDGHDPGNLHFPFWLVPALQWMCDTRDPFNSGHGYVWGGSMEIRMLGIPAAGTGQKPIRGTSTLCGLSSRTACPSTTSPSP
jgi:aldehyde:ferredoxin oxidoreductase